MLRFARFAVTLTGIILLPALAFAQASITGIVRDTSGAVLPGVTVEATSPVLIERVRTATTDGTGQFRIVDLRPGAYVVTFTLTGFMTFKREGIELTGSFTATVICRLTLCVSTIGLSPVTVTDSSSDPTFKSAFTDAVNEPVSSMPSRLKVMNPVSVNVTT